MTFSISLATGIFLLGGASGAWLARVRYITVTNYFREQVTQQVTKALNAKRKVGENDCTSMDGPTDSTVITRIIERKESEIAQIRAEVAALHTCIQFLTHPIATWLPTRINEAGVPLSICRRAFARTASRNPLPK
jgi:hypothetical protein